MKFTQRIHTPFVIGTMLLTPLVLAGQSLSDYFDSILDGSAVEPAEPQPDPVPVRLYLIDTAVENESGFFEEHSNITVHDSKLVAGPNDGQSSIAFEHGTKVLSTITCPEIGIPEEVPVEVISYDVYPNGEDAGSSITLISSAVNDAEYHYLTNPEVPSIICIAGGTQSPELSEGLEAHINSAVETGITVIVSAGNAGDDAALYAPGAYGTHPGVVSVGATTSGGVLASSSNYGSSVDFYALGENVPCYDPTTYSVAMDSVMHGTSASTALATAEALRQLSLNPESKPDELEDLLRLRFGSTRTLAQIIPSPDSDGDGSPDPIELLHGSKPDSSADRPESLSLTRQDDTDVLKFKLSTDLVDPTSPYQLADGSTWEVRRATTGNTWDKAEGTLQLGSVANGMIDATFTAPAGHDDCLYRIEVTPPMP